jgi:O-antigen ligase
LAGRGIQILDHNVHLAFLALILYAFLSWVISTAFDPTYNSLRAFFALKSQFVDYYMLVLIFCYGVGSLDDRLWLLRAVVNTLLFFTGAVLLDYLLGLQVFGTRGGRLQGLTGDPNQTGLMLVFFLPVATAATLTFGGRWRWLSWMLILITVLLLLATGSRGAYLSAIAGPLIAAWFLRHWVNFFTVLKIALLVLVVVILLLFFAVFILKSPLIIDRIQSLWDVISGLFEAAAPQQSTTGTVGVEHESRWMIWRAVLRVMMEWPMSFIVGYGWFSYGQFGIWKGAHSEYLDVLFNLGLIGLVALIWVFAALIGHSRAALSTLPAPLRWLQLGYLFGFASLLIGITFVKIPDVWSLCFVFAGLMLGFQVRGEEAAGAAPSAPARKIAPSAESGGESLARPS